MSKQQQTTEQAVASLLKRISEAGRKQRLSNNTSQADQADIASISIKALQKIEAGESGNSSVLFKYLHSLDLLHLIYTALPDPTELTPIEKFEIQAKNTKIRASGKTKESRIATAPGLKAIDKNIKWGDET